ncbi:hypothetical protein [Antrihabitans sp. YC2-6]|uniref:hypothetical protein n=1 Tax=Antrihabitans sp. YC2-6 TaxID=2799498 RepID=UPI0018F3DA92|nr:hypothetical protein [Antrihabitans sp. YC2-6]MBJ8346370.1 hypothetical protein [Antrihabitans sp. YC2-6]
MLYLFGQMWIWILIAFALGLLIGFFIGRGRKPERRLDGEMIDRLLDREPVRGGSGRHQAPE